MKRCRDRRKSIPYHLKIKKICNGSSLKSRTLCPGTAKGEIVYNRDIEGREGGKQQETCRFFITRKGSVKQSADFSLSTRAWFVQCVFSLWKLLKCPKTYPRPKMNPRVLFLHWNPSNQNLFIPDWIHQPHPKQHPERPAPGGKGQRHLCLEAGQVPRVRQHQWPQCGSPRPQEAASEHTGGAPQLWQVCGR